MLHRLGQGLFGTPNLANASAAGRAVLLFRILLVAKRTICNCVPVTLNGIELSLIVAVVPTLQAELVFCCA